MKHQPTVFSITSTTAGVVSVAKVEYELVKPASPASPIVMDITHTLVPEAFRGQGVAKVLVDAAVAYARANGMKVKPTCSYVAAYFNKAGKENADLLA